MLQSMKIKIIAIILTMILISSSIIWYSYSKDSDKESDDDLNPMANIALPGNNTVQLDPILRMYKPGIYAEKIMQLIHGSSILKNDTYLKNWSQEEIIDHQMDWGNDSYYYNEILTGRYRNTYYSTKSEFNESRNNSYPQIIIEGNSSMGCSKIRYIDDFSDEPGHIENDEAKDQVKSLLLSIVDEIGLTMYGNEIFVYADSYSPPYDSNFYFSSLKVFQNFTNLSPHSYYFPGIQITLNAKNEISYLGINCWINKESIPEDVISPSDALEISLDYIEQTYDEYWKIGGYFELETDGYLLYYSGYLGVEIDSELWERTIYISAVDGKIIRDTKFYWQIHGAPLFGWKVKTDKNEYSVGEEVHIELWLASYTGQNGTVSIRVPPLNQLFNITNNPEYAHPPIEWYSIPDDWNFLNVTFSNQSEVLVYEFIWNQTYEMNLSVDMPINEIGMQVEPGTYWIQSYLANYSNWPLWSRRMITIG